MTLIIDGIIFSLRQQGGIGVYFQELIHYLSSIQFKTKLMLYKPVLRNIDNVFSNVSVDYREARILERYCSCQINEKASVYHSSYYRLPSYKNIQTVVTVYDFIYERYIKGPPRWIHSHQKYKAIKRANAVICISETTRNDLLEFIGKIPQQSVYVIYLGVSKDFVPLYLKPVLIPYVLFVGKREGYKNFKFLLEAMLYLPHIELCCVGGGVFQDKELSGVPESVRKRVKHVGYIDNKVLNIFYNQALCLVYPSKYEGFGIPVIEAMSAGCPVVSIECKAVLEVGQGALTVVIENDPKRLADAIEKTTSYGRSSIIQKGLSIASKYSWEATCRQTLNVYRSMSNT